MKIVNGFQQLAVFANSFILDYLKGSECSISTPVQRLSTRKLQKIWQSTATIIVIQNEGFVQIILINLYTKTNQNLNYNFSIPIHWIYISASTHHISFLAIPDLFMATVLAYQRAFLL